MSSLFDSFDIKRLSVDERVQLAQVLLDSIETEQVPLTATQRQELDRRLAALQADPENVIPWEEVEARALKRFGK